MDRSYRQKIDDCTLVQRGDELIVNVTSRQDISLEAWTFAGKADFFADVFGLHPILERKG
jgi:exopolyphosphatase/guanosine-5'-triphosphate,3'-diphosphate pyrophosphatase